MLIAAISVALLAGCGASKPRAAAPKAERASATVAPIELPKSIDESTRFDWERTLYLLPSGHPDRRALRDLIVDSLARSFEASPEKDVEGRLALYEEALKLHDPTDFEAGNVAAHAVPMARWAVRTFEPRGDEALVLASLSFLRTADPADTAARERYLALAEWSESVRKSIEDPVERLGSLVEISLRLVSLVPDKAVVEHLAELYLARQRAIVDRFRQVEAAGAGGDMSPYEALMQAGSLRSMPGDLIYIFNQIGNPAGARPYMEQLLGDGGARQDFVDLLDDIARGRDEAENYFTIADLVGAREPLAGLRLCVRARNLDRANPRYPLCVARFFEEMKHPEGAIDFYAEAADLEAEGLSAAAKGDAGAGADEDNLAQILDLYRRAMFGVHMAEKTRDALRAVDTADRLARRALALDPGPESDLRMVVAALVYSCGEVEFDDGRVEAAKEHLRRSSGILANVPALAKLSEVYYLAGAYEDAAKTIEEAVGVMRSGAGPTPFWRAVLKEKLADCRAALGDKDKARELYKDALAEWAGADLSAEEAPEAAVRRGIVLDRLDDRAASQEAFRQAIRMDPDRRTTYAEILSFLAAGNRLDDAKEFYGLAYNQDRIEGMWKIYYSLWVEGLSRRLGRGSVDQAVGYLTSSNGSTWQDKLAGLFTGRVTLADLRAAAANKGQAVEAEYYGAILSLAGGRADEARAMLDKVVASELMGFFEYRMAKAILAGELRAK